MVPRYGKRNIKLSLFSADRLIYRENLKKKKKKTEKTPQTPGANKQLQ